MKEIITAILIGVFILVLPVMLGADFLVSSSQALGGVETCLGLEGVELTALLHQADEAYEAENEWQVNILMKLIFTATGGIGEQRGFFLYNDNPVLIVDTPNGYHTIVTYSDDLPDTRDVDAVECFILVEELPEQLTPYDFSEST